MHLQPGTRLGPYEVVGPIGAGGMGEVYRANDTRLDRIVALKVLPALLANDPEFRERFDREARSVSALTHPNICTLYDVGEHRLEPDGSASRFIVMEYLEGETLAARLEQGPLPVGEAVTVAIEIASALEKAHRHGVVHRDLKPANVMLTKTGTKLLDFGLAKSTPGGALSAAATVLATLTSPPAGMRTTPLTTQGTILGTIQYMSPEQVEGEEVGPRSDLFSFGALLFEMVTGRKAFTGKSHASLLGAILKEEPPPVSQLQPMVPPALDRLVKACLAKDPEERLQSAHDLLLQLRWIQEGGSAVGLPAPVVAHRRHRERFAWTALTVVSLLWLLTLIPAMRSLRTPPDAHKFQFTIDAQDVGFGNALSFAVSPDGRRIVYVQRHPTTNGPALWLRVFEDEQPRLLAGTEGASAPFWSPDSMSIGFVAGGRLRTLNVNTGSPQTLFEVPVQFLGGTWNRSGTILFAHGSSSTQVSLFRIDERGGEASIVLGPDRSRQQFGLTWPQFLPDGRHFIYFTTSSDAEKRAIHVGSLDGGPPVQLIRSAGTATYADGFLLYPREGSLVAHRFDTDRLELSGNPVPIAGDVVHARLQGRTAVSVSSNGVLAYRAGSLTDPISQMAWVNRTGQTIATLGEPAPYNQIRLSPDEKRIAAVLPHSRSYGYNIWTMDLGNGILTQTTFEETANDPVWAPDSQSILFESMRTGKRDFFRQVVGSRSPQLVYQSEEDPKWLNDWSRDGRFVLFHLPRPGKLFALPVDGDNKPILVAETTGNFDGAHFSADGKWVAYQTNESGPFEVWVAAFPTFDNRRRVSARGGGQAFWRGDGKELFFLSLDGKMMSVAITQDAGGIQFEAPTELFQSAIVRPLLTVDQYAVSGDGQRFLMLQPPRDTASSITPLTIIVNWPSGIPK